ncbi:hypothetical protein D3C87_263320 [compost metagenome]
MITFIFIVFILILTVFINNGVRKVKRSAIEIENSITRINFISLLVLLVGIFFINSMDDPDGNIEVENVEIENPSENIESETVQDGSEKDINKQFSPWDGSHFKLEEYVKNNMKNPDSYEHVSSEYKARDNYLEVHLTYRGTNSYNAVVTEKVIAKCDLSTGNVLEIIR